MVIETEAYRNPKRGIHAAVHDVSIDEDETSASDGGGLSDGIRFLWRGRNWFFIPALLGVLPGLVIIYLTGVMAPSSTTYRSAVSLTMIGAEPGKYSNGLAYAPTDLRSAGVLHDVYGRNDLARYGMSETDFSAAVSVEAYSPVQFGVAERFRAQLRDRNLTTEERRTIEQQFRTALEQTKSDGVLISFTVPDNIRVPAGVATKVVTDIPAVWSKLYTEVLGVSEPLIARSEGTLVDAQLAESLDYPLAFDYIVDSLDRLKERLQLMMEQPGAMNAAVPGSNVTIYDLQRSADRINMISIDRVLRPIIDSGVSRDAMLTGLSYENKIEQLRDQERLAAARANVVSGVIAEGNSVEQRMNQGAATDPNASPSFTSNTTIPQFGDTFIDRIIGLSVTGAGVEFRQNLLNRKLELGEQAAVLAKERETAERRLAGIRSFESESSSTSELTDKFSTTLKAVVVETNSIWGTANELLGVLSAEMLNEDKELYSSLPIDGRVLRTNFIASPYLWMVVLGLIGTLGVLGMIAYVLRSVINYRRRSA